MALHVSADTCTSLSERVWDGSPSQSCWKAAKYPVIWTEMTMKKPGCRAAARVCVCAGGVQVRSGSVSILPSRRINNPRRRWWWPSWDTLHHRLQQQHRQQGHIGEEKKTWHRWQNGVLCHRLLISKEVNKAFACCERSALLLKVKWWSYSSFFQTPVRCRMMYFGNLTIKMPGFSFPPSPTFHFTFVFLLRARLVRFSSTTSHGSVCFDSRRCVTEFHLPRPLISLFPCRLSNTVAWEVKRGTCTGLADFSTPQGSIGELRELSYH